MRLQLASVVLSTLAQLGAARNESSSHPSPSSTVLLSSSSGIPHHTVSYSATSTWSTKTRSTATTLSSTPSPSPSSSPRNGSSSQVPSVFVPGVSFQINIQNVVDSSKAIQSANNAKVWDVDLFLATPSEISILQSTGAVVICYFNAGAVQTTDCDIDAWQSAGLFTNTAVSGYSQEKYVDVTNPDVVALHKKRLDLAAQIGCDGVDPDNIDTYELSASKSVGKQITEQDMITFMSTLATYAHSKTTLAGYPMMIGQKNAYEIADRLSPFIDFAVLEGCLGSGPDDEVCSVFEQYYVQNGKPVFDIEYPTSLIGSGANGCAAAVGASDVTAMCSTANSAGISRIMKLNNDDYGLNGCTQYCYQTASFVVPTLDSDACFTTGM